MTSQQVVILGSGGWIPNHGRATSCLAIRVQKRLVLLDAGTGVANLRSRPDLLHGVEAVDIFLSHFHLDHVIGISYLPGWGLPPISVSGPGALFGSSTRVILESLSSPPFFSAPLSSYIADVKEVTEGENRTDGLDVQARIQERHPGKSLAYRLGDLLTYCTDTAVDPANGAFARGSKILLHEAWGVDSSPEPYAHSSAAEAAEIAQASGVERLKLIHLPPRVADYTVMLDAARAIFPQTSLARDFEELS